MSIFNGSKTRKIDDNPVALGILSTGDSERMQDTGFRLSSGNVSGRTKTT